MFCNVFYRWRRICLSYQKSYRKILIFFSYFCGFLFSSNFWYNSSTIFYLTVLALLILVKYFGLTSSGSQRWLNLYFLNLQPSELMKIGLILFLAKYYHKISSTDVNRLKYLFQPLIALLVPVLLVVIQPDLGTSVLIAAGGIAVIWLAGVKVQFFCLFWHYFLVYCTCCNFFFKALSKI